MNAVKNKMSELKRSLNHFDDDEAGMEAIQVVVIAAVGAVILAILWKWGSGITKWAGEKMKDWKSTTDDTSGFDGAENALGG